MVNIYISPVAVMKMQTLVMGYDKEVGWYGTVEKIADEKFRIKDILVFPQYTSSCFIDDERDNPLELRDWLDTLSDEDYESRRLWGHSHVNMGTFFSGEDNAMFDRQKHIYTAATVNRFSIAVIMNKRLEMTWRVYDADTDKEYKDSDINVMFEVEEGVSNLEYFEKSKMLVRDIYPTTHFMFGKSYGNKYSDTYGGYHYGNHNNYLTSKSKEDKPLKEEKVEDDETVCASSMADALNAEDWEEIMAERDICEYEKELGLRDAKDNYLIYVNKNGIQSVNSIYVYSPQDDDIVFEDSYDLNSNKYIIRKLDKDINVESWDNLLGDIILNHSKEVNSAEVMSMEFQTEDGEVILPIDSDDVEDMLNMYVVDCVYFEDQEAPFTYYILSNLQDNAETEEEEKKDEHKQAS